MSCLCIDFVGSHVIVGRASFGRFGGSLIVSSNHGNKVLEDDGADASSRCLAQTSVASVGLLSLLARLSYSSDGL